MLATPVLTMAYVVAVISLPATIATLGSMCLVFLALWRLATTFKVLAPDKRTRLVSRSVAEPSASASTSGSGSDQYRRDDAPPSAPGVDGRRYTMAV